MLAAEGIRLTRGNFSLEVAALEIPEGTCAGLVGPNGAGKTTLLSVLSGALHSPGAKVSFQAVPLSELGFARGLLIGNMPDELQGVQSLSVREHLAIRAQCFPGWDQEYQRELVKELGIPLDQSLNKLSKGTRAKVAFASVEAYRPPLLILDEPTTGLDPMVRRELRGALRRALRESPRRSILFSTHLVEDLHDLVNRLITIQSGRVLSDDLVPPEASKEVRMALVESALDALERSAGDSGDR